MLTSVATWGSGLGSTCKSGTESALRESQLKRAGGALYQVVSGAAFAPGDGGVAVILQVPVETRRERNAAAAAHGHHHAPAGQGPEELTVPLKYRPLVKPN
jgi:hypothetical protein